MRRKNIAKAGGGGDLIWLRRPSLQLEEHAVVILVPIRVLIRVLALRGYLLPQVGLDEHAVLVRRANVHRKLSALGVVELVMAALVGALLIG